MNDLEDRLRRGLRADLAGVDPEQLLDDVCRGAARRRRRRATVLVAVSAIAIAGIAGVAVQATRGDSGRPPASPTPSPSSSPTEVPLPTDASRGVSDIDLVPGGAFKLTTNVGCSGCSTVWRQDSSAEGGWRRLHDFGREAYGEGYDPSYGPIGDIAMAANGRDGWAPGAAGLYSTHDGGNTWREITAGPGGQTDQGHEVVLTKRFAWSFFRGFEGPPQLYRTTLGSDDWTKVDAPDAGGVIDVMSTDDAVVLVTADEGLATPRIRASQDGSSWSRLDLPCGGENQMRPAETEVFVLCATDTRDPAVVYRTRDLARWEVFGHVTRTTSAMCPLSDDRLLMPGLDSDARLLTPGATTTVDTGLQRADTVLVCSSLGDDSYLTTFDTRNRGSLIHSNDGGRTWEKVE